MQNKLVVNVGHMVPSSLAQRLVPTKDIVTTALMKCQWIKSNEMQGTTLTVINR